jgi:FtsH-binding integral membrane protein
MCFLATYPSNQNHHHGFHSKVESHDLFIITYRHYLHDHGLRILMSIILIISSCALMCCGFDKTYPMNYGFLGAFTFAKSWLIAGICAKAPPMVVFQAACLTSAAVVAITLYSWTTKTDFTLCGPALFIFGMVFGVAGIIIVSCGFKLGIVWAIIGVILFSFYLVWDT